jgi:alanine racemase
LRCDHQQRRSGCGAAQRLYRTHPAPAQRDHRRDLDAALRYGVEEIAGNLALATLASNLAGERGAILPVHIGINSAGISRMGLELATEQGQRDALAIARLPHLNVVGIMTHFPVEEAADVRRGFEAFQRESAWLIEQAGLDRRKLTLHTANSFATLEVPETRLDLVRVGGALYGDTVPSHTEYRRVMQFKSRVTSVMPSFE